MDEKQTKRKQAQGVQTTPERAAEGHAPAGVRAQDLGAGGDSGPQAVAWDLGDREF